jgi:hypothetical protein
LLAPATAASAGAAKPQIRHCGRPSTVKPPAAVIDIGAITAVNVSCNDARRAIQVGHFGTHPVFRTRGYSCQSRPSAIGYTIACTSRRPGRSSGFQFTWIPHH